MCLKNGMPREQQGPGGGNLDSEMWVKILVKESNPAITVLQSTCMGEGVVVESYKNLFCTRQCDLLVTC